MDINSMKKQTSNAFGNDEKILVCSCFRMEKKATEAFAVMHSDQVLPDIIKGKDRIYKYAKEIENDHLIAISKLSGKFAYYVKLEDHKIVLEEDLLRGRRIS